MSIQEISSNFKRFIQKSDSGLALLIFTVGMASFGLGKVSGGTGIGELLGESPGEITMESSVIEAREPTVAPSAPVVSTSEPEAKGEANPTTPAPKAQVSGGATQSQERLYVGSKNGTKYHLPTCSGAKNIKEENKVWFASKEEAEGAGYSPASNCKGI